MIEETEASVSPRDHAADDHYSEALLYDFAKFLISLSLLVLGGMLTLGQAARAGQVKPLALMLVAGSISLAGILSFSVANAVVDARAREREPRKGLPVYLKLATTLLGIGLGGFLVIWLETVK